MKTLICTFIALLLSVTGAAANEQKLFPKSYYPLAPLSAESEPHASHRLLPQNYYPKKIIPREARFHDGLFRESECKGCHGFAEIPKPPPVVQGIGLPRFTVRIEK